MKRKSPLSGSRRGKPGVFLTLLRGRSTAKPGTPAESRSRAPGEGAGCGGGAGTAAGRGREPAVGRGASGGAEPGGEDGAGREKCWQRSSGGEASAFPASHSPCRGAEALGSMRRRRGPVV